jgi:hypothetical protein
MHYTASVDMHYTAQNRMFWRRQYLLPWGNFQPPAGPDPPLIIAKDYNSPHTYKNKKGPDLSLGIAKDGDWAITRGGSVSFSYLYLSGDCNLWQ